jgi:hypothetical protein
MVVVKTAEGAGLGGDVRLSAKRAAGSGCSDT